jgi:single-stranded DNA-specific DHH superfamily exonuclease
MIGRLSKAGDVRTAARQAMTDALAAFGRDGPIVVLSHFDADGLSAAAILVRALRQAGWNSEPLVIGKTGSPWEVETRDRIAALKPAGLIVARCGDDQW